jgi:protein-tyrosine phosphatase
MATTEFRVLVVCTGNLCRSVVAAAWLRHVLGDDPTVCVTSAGTGTRDGLEAPPETIRQLASVGLPVEHRSTALRPVDVARADLVLTATREHRRAVLRAEPRAAKRTFTVRELGRILAMADGPRPSSPGAGTDGLRAWVAEASRLRGLAPRPNGADDDDVVDPFGREDAVFAASWAQMRPALERIARQLRG